MAAILSLPHERLLRLKGAAYLGAIATTSVGMVQRYARIAQTDVEQAHRKASPVDNWKL